MAIRTIDVRERVMEKNDAIARDIRSRLDARGVTALNLVSSPGSGKTLLLERTLDALGDELRMAVITGDVQTQNDAERLARHTNRLVQAVVTGGACHLDARQIDNGLEAVDLDDTDLVFIENVGNLVCPASWYLGEDAKVVVFSVTEGEDKPLKYPKMFREARYAVLNKVDLLPYVPFDVDQAVECARRVNPELEFFFTSATTGDGLDDLVRFHPADGPIGPSAARARRWRRALTHESNGRGAAGGVGGRAGDGRTPPSRCGGGAGRRVPALRAPAGGAPRPAGLGAQHHRRRRDRGGRRTAGNSSASCAR